MAADMLPMKLIRRDRGRSYGYVENKKYYCIIRTAKGTTLYDIQTNEVIKVFSEIPYVVKAAFYQNNMLVLKNIDGKYFLYDIPSGSFVWKQKYKPNIENQETHFVLSASGIIIDADCNVQRPETGCILKIDPCTDRIDLYELKQIPRSIDLIYTRMNDGIFIRSGSRLWALDINNMVTTLLFERDIKYAYSEIHHCDAYGNIVYSYRKDTDNNYDYYQVACRNLNTGDEIKIDSYQSLNHAAIMENRIPPAEKTRPVFHKAYFTEDTNHIILHYSQGIKVFDLQKRAMVYANLNMNYITHISSTTSGIVIIDGKFIYFINYNDL